MPHTFVRNLSSYEGYWAVYHKRRQLSWKSKLNILISDNNNNNNEINLYRFLNAMYPFMQTNIPSLWETPEHRRDHIEIQCNSSNHIQTHNATGRAACHYGVQQLIDGPTYYVRLDLRYWKLGSVHHTTMFTSDVERFSGNS